MDYSEYAKQWATKRNSATHFAHDFLEKPAIQSLLPNSFDGLSVLCLGCGSGEECADFIHKKAYSVIGVDNAEGLIELAKIQFPQGNFICQNILDCNFKTDSFDLIYSSLSFHYIQDWQSLFSKIHSWLKPGGQCIFSVHHPVKWGAESTKNKDFTKFNLGYLKNKKDQTFSINGDYLTCRPITETLFGKLQITHYHRPISEMLKNFRQSNLVVKDCLEPLPVELAKTKKPDFYEVHSKIPLFIIWKLEK